MQQDNSLEEPTPITQTQSAHYDGKTNLYIYVLKQFWRRQIHPTRRGRLVGILVCIPLGVWIFSILAIFESGFGAFGWFWLYWIAFTTMVMVAVAGFIWRIYDILKDMKRKTLLHNQRD